MPERKTLVSNRSIVLTSAQCTHRFRCSRGPGALDRRRWPARRGSRGRLCLIGLVHADSTITAADPESLCAYVDTSHGRRSCVVRSGSCPGGPRCGRGCGRGCPGLRYRRYQLSESRSGRLGAAWRGRGVFGRRGGARASSLGPGGRRIDGRDERDELRRVRRELERKRGSTRRQLGCVARGGRATDRKVHRAPAADDTGRASGPSFSTIHRL